VALTSHGPRVSVTQWGLYLVARWQPAFGHLPASGHHCRGDIPEWCRQETQIALLVMANSL
jgi:hypothetical protein